jgi:acetyl-CoA carboxylase carboxyl transferase subunit beta
MAWFLRKNNNISTDQQQREMPDGLWTKCPECSTVIYRKELEDHAFTCPSCSHHFRVGSAKYIDVLFDRGTFHETDSTVRSADPLEFVDTRPYKARLKEAYSKSVVGEKFVRAGRRALQEEMPFIFISASGGARMQEAALSLMQMAKTSAFLSELAEAKLPYISILTDPTTGGVSASYAMLGDVIIAEPKALIGFAGPRVIEQTIRRKLPEGFQRSEFLLEHGFVDLVVHRKDLKRQLHTVLQHLMGNRRA